MANELLNAIEQIGREKGIDSEIIILALQDAVLTAARKHHKVTADLGSRYNRETGKIEVFARMKVVAEVADPDTEMSLADARKLQSKANEGDVLEINKDTDSLGRIAASAAKQVIYQKVREAERENIFSEYSGRIGEVVNGTVKRFERGDIIVDLGRAEAILPRKEQIRNERYNQGDRIRGLIVEVSKSTKGPQIVLSRSSSDFLVKLFEMEVPEIYDGTVRIVSAVREPGERAKIAVISRERDVDPVGACVGMKGSRVQAVIRELGGEKIDIVEYAEDITAFAQNALNPAKIGRVTIVDLDEKVLEVVVDDKQLSLAIGKRGQNVRLGAKLVGWKIDIKSDEEKRKEIEVEMARLNAGAKTVDVLAELGEKTIERLREAGIETVEQLASTDPQAILGIPGIGEKTAERVFACAAKYLEEAAAVTKAHQEEAERKAAEALAALEAAQLAASSGGAATTATGAVTPDPAAEPAAEAAAEPAAEAVAEAAAAIEPKDDAPPVSEGSQKEG